MVEAERQGGLVRAVNYEVIYIKGRGTLRSDGVGRGLFGREDREIDE